MTTIFNKNGNGQSNAIVVTQAGLHVFAYGGNDTVTGFAADVTVNGGLGDDFIFFEADGGLGFGGDGNDTIVASSTAGHTTKARGNAGSDTFMFDTVSFKGDGPAAMMLVSDFTPGEDVLSLIGAGTYQVTQTRVDVNGNGILDLVISFFDQANPIIGDDELNTPQPVAQQFALMGWGDNALLTSSDFVF